MSCVQAEECGDKRKAAADSVEEADTQARREALQNKSMEVRDPHLIEPSARLCAPSLDFTLASTTKC